MKTFECHYNGAVLTVSAENKADAERYAGYVLGVGKRTWLLYVREVTNLMIDELVNEQVPHDIRVAMNKLIIERTLK